MNKYIVVFCVILCAAFAVAQGANTLIYLENGGGKQVVSSGGEIEIQSGGILDIQAGATFAPGVLTLTDIDAGASGTAGSVDIFPTTASKGKLTFTATDSTGNTTTTITNADQAGARTYTIPDAGGNASFVMTAGAQTIAGVKTFSSAPVASGASITAGTIPRASLAEDALAKFEIPLLAGIITAGSGEPLLGPGSAASGTLTLGSVGTGVPGLLATAANASTETSTSGFRFTLPENYVAAGDVVLAITAKCTGAPETLTIDATAQEVDTTAGTLGADICATAVQNLTSSFVEYSFTITATSLVAGDVILVTFTPTVTIAAMTNAIFQASNITIKCDVKG